MADHLQHGAAHAQGIDGADAQQHEAHVAHGAAGDPALHVVLGKGVERAVHDVHDAQHHQGRSQGEVGLRQHLHVEAQQGIAAHLQQHARQQHRHRGVGLTVGVRQPGVQGKHGELHAEAHQEAEITEKAEGATSAALHQLSEVEGDGPVEGQGETAHQDQQRGGGGIEDELGGRVLALLAAPDGDQQVNGHQFQLPGQEEEQEVVGEEHQPLGRGLHQHQGEIEAALAADVPAGGH